MLCAAHETTALIHLAAEREKWVAPLKELLAAGLIEFYTEAPPSGCQVVSTDRALSAIDDAKEWDHKRFEALQYKVPFLWFRTTECGEEAAQYGAFHYLDGRFIPLR